MTQAGRIFGATLVLMLGAMGAAGCAGETFTGNTGGSAGSAGTTSTSSSTGGGGTGGTTTSAGGTGGTTTSSTGGTGGSGGQECQPLSDPCAQCAFDSCQAEYCVCYAELDCAALVNCISPCDPTDIACQQPCLTAHKDSISKAFLLGDCASMGCSMECAGVAPLGDCIKCMFTDCSTQMNDCLSDAECNEIVQCAALCPPGPDQQTCAFACADGKSNTAVNKALLTQGCRNQNCSAECQ